jgi:hypothetical protein
MLVSLLRSQLARCYPVSIAATSIGSHAYALKRRIRSVERSFGDTWNKRSNPATPGKCAKSPWEPSREALWKFPQAARERSPAAIIPSKWEAGWRSWLSRPGEDTPRPAAGNKQE